MTQALVDRAAITLRGGPAHGVSFVRHHFEPPYPKVISVVVDIEKITGAKIPTSAIDLLDLPEDRARSGELTTFYELDPATLVHVCARGSGGSTGWWVTYRWARKRPSIGPADDQLRLRAEQVIERWAR